jgi:hypothetical protein
MGAIPLLDKEGARGWLTGVLAQALSLQGDGVRQPSDAGAFPNPSVRHLMEDG